LVLSENIYITGSIDALQSWSPNNALRSLVSSTQETKHNTSLSETTLSRAKPYTTQWAGAR
jgi:hypothetical protein